MKYFLDSNIFLRFYTDEKNNKIFRDCSRLIEIIKDGGIKTKTSHLVIAEIVWTLQSYYKVPKDKIIKVVHSIESIPNLKIENDFVTNLAHQFFSDHSVKYIDSLIASNPEIQTKKMIVISYDRDFDKLGVKRLEPSDILK